MGFESVAFGAHLGCAGAVAIFSLDELEKLRSLDRNRDFLVSFATDAGPMDR